MRPLAERLRPQTLDEYIGQEHLVGQGAVLRQSIGSGNIPSMIFWGPPGVGKTTLASIIANNLDRPFHTLSAINSGVKDIREVIAKAKSQHFFDRPNPILFIDEIHRFSKSQQDSLLGAVEKGVITLIGATTENPSFEVIPALLSRCQVYILKHLEVHHLDLLLERALHEDEFLKTKQITIAEKEALFRISGGDARKLYNALELAIQYFGEEEVIINNENLPKIIQQNIPIYDKGGEMHYDVISAFIKSIRGSDPNAALYYLAKMLKGGEDIKFIGRRMIILASEDIGLANPNALLMANSAFQAIQAIGMPEARIILSQAVIYLACSPKSNSAYAAIASAYQAVDEFGHLPVPLPIRNAPTKLMKDLNYGANYKYAHQFENNFADMEFLPEEISGSSFYKPANNVSEERFSKSLKELWKGKYEF